MSEYSFKRYPENEPETCNYYLVWDGGYLPFVAEWDGEQWIDDISRPIRGVTYWDHLPEMPHDA